MIYLNMKTPVLRRVLRSFTQHLRNSKPLIINAYGGIYAITRVNKNNNNKYYYYRSIIEREIYPEKLRICVKLPQLIDNQTTILRSHLRKTA